jgi:hypothetical protein
LLTFLRVLGAVCGALVLSLIVGTILVLVFGWDSDVLALKGAGWVVIAIAGGRIGIEIVNRSPRARQEQSVGSTFDVDRKEPRL